jgi:hypothetical protein
MPTGFHLHTGFSSELIPILGQHQLDSLLILDLLIAEILIVQKQFSPVDSAIHQNVLPFLQKDGAIGVIHERSRFNQD